MCCNVKVSLYRETLGSARQTAFEDTGLGNYIIGCRTVRPAQLALQEERDPSQRQKDRDFYQWADGRRQRLVGTNAVDGNGNRYRQFLEVRSRQSFSWSRGRNHARSCCSPP